MHCTICQFFNECFCSTDIEHLHGVLRLVLALVPDVERAGVQDLESLVVLLSVLITCKVVIEILQRSYRLHSIEVNYLLRIFALFRKTHKHR